MGPRVVKWLFHVSDVELGALLIYLCVILSTHISNKIIIPISQIKQHSSRKSECAAEDQAAHRRSCSWGLNTGPLPRGLSPGFPSLHETPLPSLLKVQGGAGGEFIVENLTRRDKSANTLGQGDDVYTMTFQRKRKVPL